MASRGKRIDTLQGLKTKVTAAQQAAGSLDEKDTAKQRLRAAFAARDANYELDAEAEALLLRALDVFVDRVVDRAAAHAQHRGGDDAEIGAVDAQLCLEGHWGVDVPGVPAGSSARPAPRRAPFAYRRVDPTDAAAKTPGLPGSKLI